MQQSAEGGASATGTQPVWRMRSAGGASGGIAYLFVRGMSPEAPGNGVYFDQPAEALVEALDGWLAGA